MRVGFYMTGCFLLLCGFAALLLTELTLLTLDPLSFEPFTLKSTSYLYFTTLLLKLLTDVFKSCSLTLLTVSYFVLSFTVSIILLVVISASTLE
jgi:hypothetical protein